MVPIFAPLLSDPSWHVRIAAVNALGKLNDPQIIPLLLPTLSAANRDLRAATLKALSKLNDPQIIPLLQLLLTDSDRHLREATMKTLAKLNDPQVVPLLLPFITDSSYHIRNTTINLLDTLLPRSQENNNSVFSMNTIASDIISVEDAAERVRQLLGENLPTRSFFERYRPLHHWFLRPDEIGNIHGIAHEARVMVWQEILSRLLIKDGVMLDQEALRWAAATHDTQRIADGRDFPHGERAAVWVKQAFEHRLPEPCLETIVYLNAWHVPPDNYAPAMTPELAVFKDADGLDRVRIYDLDPQFLRWDYSKTLLQYLAEALFEGSEEKQQQAECDLFDCVIETAVELGLVNAE